MKRPLSLKIARRISALLGETLGEGIQPQRMVDDNLYARDVLLVCEAMIHPELRQLARSFRQAQLDADEAPAGREAMTISSVLNSIFGQSEPPEDVAAARASADTPSAGTPVARARRWFARGATRATSGGK